MPVADVERRARARELREQGGFSYAEIADALGANPATIGRWFRPDQEARAGERRKRRDAAKRDGLTRAWNDVRTQAHFDSGRESPQGLLLSRMDAALEATKALGDGEIGAREALRQSLIDIGSISVLLASEIALDPAEEREPLAA